MSGALEGRPVATSPDLCVVIPTIREASIHAFLVAWAGELAGARVLVVEDNPRRTFALAPGVEHRAWDDIERELGDRAWIIPRRTDCVRSYGFWRAWQDGARVIVTLDDDCFPAGPGVLAEHRARLDATPEVPRWVTTGGGVRTRGLPYRRRGEARRCVLNHGLWTNVPDLDALTQMDCPDPARAFQPVDQVVPHGMYFPMCGMNVAFHRDLAPAMYFLLMGPDHEFDRFGDIWCGVLMKRICDHLGFSVRSGGPLVEHRRASNVWDNLRKEAPGYAQNETFWSAVDGVALTASTVAGCYAELARRLPLTGPYWDRTREAMSVWAGLFSTGEVP